MNQNTLNIGIYTGLAGVLLFLLIAVVDGGGWFLFGVGAISIAISIIIPVIYLRKERESNGGFLEFKEAFKIAFLGLLIAGAISTVFTLIYTQVIDTEFGERATYKSLEMTKGFMEGRVPEAQMEEQLREVERQGLKRYTPLGMLKSYGWAAIFYAVIALIVGAAMKKKPETV